MLSFICVNQFSTHQITFFSKILYVRPDRQQSIDDRLMLEIQILLCFTVFLLMFAVYGRNKDALYIIISVN
jgi:hypothetical protein